MQNFQIFDLNDGCLRFRGECVVKIETDVLEFSDFHAWYELLAFRRQQGGWVVAVVIKRSGRDEVAECIGHLQAQSGDELENPLHDFSVSDLLPSSPAARHYYETAASELIAQVRGMEFDSDLASVQPSWPRLNRIRRLAGF